MAGLPKSEWVWMPHPGHLIVALDCRFHLNTYVGGYIVSTVGEYLPDSAVREIFAQSRGVTLEGRGDSRRYDYMKKIGYEKIGWDRLYETMVFPAKSNQDDGKHCCPWLAADWSELDTRGYNDSEAAARGHLEMCEKWAVAQITQETVNE